MAVRYARATSPIYPVSGECPWCQHQMKFAAPMKGWNGRPTLGSFTVCHRCSMVSLYTEDLSRRKVTEQELESLDKEVLDAVLAEVVRVTLKRHESEA